MNLRSPQTHLAFQKLFGLPTEEFLINDYTCYLKRKMPLQVIIIIDALLFMIFCGHATRKLLSTSGTFLKYSIFSMYTKRIWLALKDV